MMSETPTKVTVTLHPRRLTCAVVGCPNESSPTFALCSDHKKAWETFSARKDILKTYNGSKALMAFAFLAQAEKDLKKK